MPRSVASKSRSRHVTSKNRRSVALKSRSRSRSSRPLALKSRSRSRRPRSRPVATKSRSRSRPVATKSRSRSRPVATKSRSRSGRRPVKTLYAAAMPADGPHVFNLLPETSFKLPKDRVQDVRDFLAKNEKWYKNGAAAYVKGEYERWPTFMTIIINSGDKKLAFHLQSGKEAKLLEIKRGSQVAVGYPLLAQEREYFKSSMPGLNFINDSLWEINDILDQLIDWERLAKWLESIVTKFPQAEIFIERDIYTF